MRAAAGALAVLLTALAVGGAAGCSRAKAEPPLLEITRQRWNVDEKAGVVRVVGEIANLGQTTAPPVVVRAVLRGSSDESRGENSTPALRDLLPGDKRQFALNVRSHGGVAKVDLTWQEERR